MLRRVSVVGVLLLFGIANATHPGTAIGYELLGFSADGKHAYFKKSISSMMSGEKWLAVYDGATTKLVTSQPIYRMCGDDPTIRGSASPTSRSRPTAAARSWRSRPATKPSR